MFTVQVLTHDTVLNPLQQRAAFRKLGHPKLPQPGVEIPADDCLRLWVIMLLGKLEFLAPEQKTFIFDSLTADLNGVGVTLFDAIQNGTTLKQVPMLVVGDGRYIAWSGYTGWLDLVSGDNVEEPKELVLETVAYNLAVLFGRNALACQKLQRRMDHADDRQADK